MGMMTDRDIIAPPGENVTEMANAVAQWSPQYLWSVLECAMVP